MVDSLEEVEEGQEIFGLSFATLLLHHHCFKWDERFKVG